MTKEDKYIIIQYFKNAKLIIIGLVVWSLFSILIFNSIKFQVDKIKFVTKVENKVLKTHVFISRQNTIHLPVEFLLVLKDTLERKTDNKYSFESIETLISIKETNKDEWIVYINKLKHIEDGDFINLFLYSINNYIHKKLKKQKNKNILTHDALKISLDSDNNKATSLLVETHTLKSILKNEQYKIKLLYVFKNEKNNIFIILRFIIISVLMYFSIVLYLIYVFRIKKYHIEFMKVLNESKIN